MGIVGVDGPGGRGRGEGRVFGVGGVAGVGFCEEEGFAEARLGGVFGGKRSGGGFGIKLVVCSHQFGDWVFRVSF